MGLRLLLNRPRHRKNNREAIVLHPTHRDVAAMDGARGETWGTRTYGMTKRNELLRQRRLLEGEGSSQGDAGIGCAGHAGIMEVGNRDLRSSWVGIGVKS